MEKINYTEYKKPSDYLKFEQGENIVRVLSGGGMYLKHSLKTGKTFIPLGECEGDGCKHCAKGNVPKQTWIWIGINRTTKKIGIMETGAMIGNAVCEIAKQEGKDPQEFDLSITKSGLGLKTKYDVWKNSKSTDLTPEEEKIVKQNKQYLISKRFGK